MKLLLAILHWPALGLRAAVVAGALVAWFWTQSLIARKPAPKAGIGDAVHDLTAKWHRYFFTNDRAANALLVTSSAFIAPSESSRIPLRARIKMFPRNL